MCFLMSKCALFNTFSASNLNDFDPQNPICSNSHLFAKNEQALCKVHFFRTSNFPSKRKKNFHFKFKFASKTILNLHLDSHKTDNSYSAQVRITVESRLLSTSLQEVGLPLYQIRTFLKLFLNFPNS